MSNRLDTPHYNDNDVSSSFIEKILGRKQHMDISEIYKNAPYLTAPAPTPPPMKPMPKLTWQQLMDLHLSHTNANTHTENEIIKH